MFLVLLALAAATTGGTTHGTGTSRAPGTRRRPGRARAGRTRPRPSRLAQCPGDRPRPPRAKATTRVRPTLRAKPSTEPTATNASARTRSAATHTRTGPTTADPGTRPTVTNTAPAAHRTTSSARATHRGHPTRRQEPRRHGRRWGADRRHHRSRPVRRVVDQPRPHRGLLPVGLVGLVGTPRAGPLGVAAVLVPAHLRRLGDPVRPPVVGLAGDDLLLLLPLPGVVLPLGGELVHGAGPLPDLVVLRLLRTTDLGNDRGRRDELPQTGRGRGGVRLVVVEHPHGLGLGLLRGPLLHVLVGLPTEQVREPGRDAEEVRVRRGVHRHRLRHRVLRRRVVVHQRTVPTLGRTTSGGGVRRPLRQRVHSRRHRVSRGPLPRGPSPGDRGLGPLLSTGHQLGEPTPRVRRRDRPLNPLGIQIRPAERPGRALTIGALRDGPPVDHAVQLGVRPRVPVVLPHSHDCPLLLLSFRSSEW